MRLPRMSTRRMMIAAAVIALLLGAGIGYRRHLQLREIAFRHEDDCRIDLEFAQDEFGWVETVRSANEGYAKACRKTVADAREEFRNRLEQSSKSGGRTERSEIERRFAWLGEAEAKIEGEIASAQESLARAKIEAEGRAEKFRASADWHAELARKYRRGMWRPWLPTEPDPPPPEDPYSKPSFRRPLLPSENPFGTTESDPP